MQEEQIKYQQKSELQKLGSESKSQYSNNINPFACGSPSDQSIHLNREKIFSKHELHDLIFRKEKSVDDQSKQTIELYIKKVLILNNEAYEKLIKLEKYNNDQTLMKNVPNQHNSTKNQKSNQTSINNNTDTYVKSQSIQIESVESTDKLQHQIQLLLTEAEMILEYAASCGKAIDRNLIISVLSNFASFYQKISQLKKSCLYLEAVIINIQQWREDYIWNRNSVQFSPVIKNSPRHYELNFLTKNGLLNIEDDVILMNMRKSKNPHVQCQVSNCGQVKPEQNDKLAKNYELSNQNIRLNIHNNCEQLHLKEIQNLVSFPINKDKIRQHIKNLFELVVFYLQYSSLCGQLGAHEQAISIITKAIENLKKLSHLNRKIYSYEQLSSQFQNSFQKFPIGQMNGKQSQNQIIHLDNRKIVLGLTEIEYGPPDNLTDSQHEKYRQTAKFYLKLNNSIGLSNGSQKNEENNENNTKQNKTKIQLQLIEAIRIKKAIKELSISDILRIKANKYRLETQQTFEKSNSNPGGQLLGLSSLIKKNIKLSDQHYQFNAQSQNKQGTQSSQEQSELFSFQMSKSTNTFDFNFLFSNALLVSTAYFIMATELRIQATQRQVNEGDRFEQKNYKQSEIYHLMAIIVLSIYTPLEISYLRHIVSSYQSYYVRQLNPIDQLRSNYYENGPCSRSSSNSKNQNILNLKYDKYEIYSYFRIKLNSAKPNYYNYKRHTQFLINSPTKQHQQCFNDKNDLHLSNEKILYQKKSDLPIQLIPNQNSRFKNKIQQTDFIKTMHLNYGLHKQQIKNYSLGRYINIYNDNQYGGHKASLNTKKYIKTESCQRRKKQRKKQRKLKRPMKIPLQNKSHNKHNSNPNKYFTTVQKTNYTLKAKHRHGSLCQLPSSLSLGKDESKPTSSMVHIQLQSHKKKGNLNFIPEKQINQQKVNNVNENINNYIQPKHFGFKIIPRDEHLGEILKKKKLSNKKKQPDHNYFYGSQSKFQKNKINKIAVHSNSNKNLYINQKNTNQKVNSPKNINKINNKKNSKGKRQSMRNYEVEKNRYSQINTINRNRGQQRNFRISNQHLKYHPNCSKNKNNSCSPSKIEQTGVIHSTIPSINYQKPCYETQQPIMLHRTYSYHSIFDPPVTAKSERKNTKQIKKK